MTFKCIFFPIISTLWNSDTEIFAISAQKLFILKSFHPVNQP